MEKIKQHPFFWSLLFSLIVVFIINSETGASLLLVYFFVGLFWLLAASIKAAKQKRSKKTPPSQTAHPVANQGYTTIENKLVHQRAVFSHQIDLGNVAYFYNDVGVFVPDINKLNNPEAELLGVVVFAKEPNNPYDQRAILVAQSIGPVGYLYRGRIQNMVNDWLDKGKQVFGYISYLNMYQENVNKDGLKIDIVFYE